MSSVPTDDPQDLRAAAPERVRLRLFVAGDSARAGLALRSLQALIGSSLPPDTELVVVDILAHPELAEELGVLATPLVIKMSPRRSGGWSATSPTSPGSPTPSASTERCTAPTRGRTHEDHQR